MTDETRQGDEPEQEAKRPFEFRGGNVLIDFSSFVLDPETEVERFARLYNEAVARGLIKRHA